MYAPMMDEHALSTTYHDQSRVVLNSFDPTPRNELSLITLQDKDEWHSIKAIAAFHQPQTVALFLPDYLQLKRRAHLGLQTSAGTQTISLHPTQIAVLPAIQERVPIDMALCLASDAAMIIPRLEEHCPSLLATVVVADMHTDSLHPETYCRTYYEHHVLPGVPGLYQCPELHTTNLFHGNQAFITTAHTLADYTTPPRFKEISLPEANPTGTCTCSLPAYRL